MTFQKIQTSLARKQPARKEIPEGVTPLWGILRNVRAARAAFGLNDRAITVLQALISLIPKDNSRTRIFASNLTLSDRANGMGERTLRRHLATLVDLGLIERHDSANRKRYARRDPDSGELIGYGFDLSPMLKRAEEIANMAAEAHREAGRIALLRDRLSALRQTLIERGDAEDSAEIIRKMLRRKLSLAQLQELLLDIEGNIRSASPTPPASTSRLSGNDGQNDRHIQRSYTKEFESKESALNNSHPSELFWKNGDFVGQDLQGFVFWQ